MTYKEAVKEFHRLKGIEVRKQARLLDLEGIRHACKKDYEHIEAHWTEAQCRIMWVFLRDNIRAHDGLTCIFCIFREMLNMGCAMCMWANNHGGKCGWVHSEYKYMWNNPVDQIAWEAYEKLIKSIEKKLEG
jgi:hypothetical protein